MKDLVKACILAASLILLLGSGALAYEFGSKVNSSDADEGKLLESFPGGTALAPTIAFLDVGVNPGVMDENDVVYLDFNGNFLVDVADLRLTPYDTMYAAGTKVKAGDLDFNLGPMLAFVAPAGQIFFANRYGGPGYDFKDPVYIKTSPLPLTTDINDVRLSNLQGLKAGSKVQNFHGDFDSPLTLMLGAAGGVINLGLGPIVELRFYNINGNVNVAGAPIYDSDDPVYLDVSFPGFGAYGMVTPNDVRLSV